MIEAFQRFIKVEQLFQKGHPVLVAVSGGVDSTVLCSLLDELDQPFGMAHCNFQLRGEASNKDEALVQQVAQNYGVEFWSTSFDTEQQAKRQGISIQMAARQLRYQWLETIRKDNGFHFIATAHHKKDVAETLLLNLIRGTGIRGLHGILPKQTLQFEGREIKVVRPLLFATKQQIRQYAEENEIQYRQDSSNQELHYDRNRLRHKVIPPLKEMNPRLEETLWENTQRLREAEALYEHAIQHFKQRLLHQTGEEIFIDYHKLELYPGSLTLLFEILSPYGFNESQVREIYSSLEGQPGQQFYSDSHRLVKDRQYLVVSSKESDRLTTLMIPKGKKKVTLQDLQLRFQIVSSSHFKISADPRIACVDKGLLDYPLQLRRWREGDYFYPLGMGGKKKKLQDFFTDQKLSIVQKEQTWILFSGPKVVWVVGYRLDERFKVTEKTKKIVKIKQLPT